MDGLCRMIQMTKENITESIKHIESIVRKIEAIDKNRLKQPQLTLMERRLVALNLSLQLLTIELVKINL